MGVMTLRNACGASIEDWKHRTAFLCPRCLRSCPPKLMAAYDSACLAFERFKKEEYRRSLIGMLPRSGQREKLLGRVSRAWYAARADIKGRRRLEAAE
jgi:hypothetical protein